MISDDFEAQPPSAAATIIVVRIKRITLTPVFWLLSNLPAKAELAAVLAITKRRYLQQQKQMGRVLPSSHD
jgi:hypothetical protein